MISPLLAGGVSVSRARAGCACSRKVMAFVWNYLSRLSYLGGNRPAIICMGSCAGLVAIGRWVFFSAGRPTYLDNGRERA